MKQSNNCNDLIQPNNQRLDKENMTADYEYYKDKTDYYYDTKIPFYKKFITKRIVKKITDSFD